MQGIKVLDGCENKTCLLFPDTVQPAQACRPYPPRPGRAKRPEQWTRGRRSI